MSSPFPDITTENRDSHFLKILLNLDSPVYATRETDAATASYLVPEEETTTATKRAFTLGEPVSGGDMHSSLLYDITAGAPPPTRYKPSQRDAAYHSVIPTPEKPDSFQSHDGGHTSFNGTAPASSSTTTTVKGGRVRSARPNLQRTRTAAAAAAAAAASTQNPEHSIHEPQSTDERSLITIAKASGIDVEEVTSEKLREFMAKFRENNPDYVGKFNMEHMIVVALVNGFYSEMVNGQITRFANETTKKIEEVITEQNSYTHDFNGRIQQYDQFVVGTLAEFKTEIMNQFNTFKRETLNREAQTFKDHLATFNRVNQSSMDLENRLILALQQYDQNMLSLETATRDAKAATQELSVMLERAAAISDPASNPDHAQLDPAGTGVYAAAFHVSASLAHLNQRIETTHRLLGILSQTDKEHLMRHLAITQQQLDGFYDVADKPHDPAARLPVMFR